MTSGSFSSKYRSTHPHIKICPRHIHTHAFTHTCIHTHTHTHTHICVHIHTYMCRHTHTHVHAHKSTHIHVQTHTHSCACTQEYTHVHTHTQITKARNGVMSKLTSGKKSRVNERHNSDHHTQYAHQGQRVLLLHAFFYDRLDNICPFCIWWYRT